jgi:hypothetical protein
MRHQLDRAQEGPLVWIHPEVSIDENAMPGFAGFLLQWQGNDVQDAQVPWAHGCAGAAQVPKPPLGMVSWLGNSRSYEVRLSCRVRLQARLIMAVPKRLASRAGIAVVKKIHACEPLPDRDISSAKGTSNSRQDSPKALASSRHSALSKSTARK